MLVSRARWIPSLKVSYAPLRLTINPPARRYSEINRIDSGLGAEMRSEK
jgi:hypothetical protein